MSFRLLSAADPAWDEHIASLPHDVYHLSGYARLTESHEPYRVQLAVVEREGDTLAMPVMLRPLPAGLPESAGRTDVTVPYGYPGPVASTADVARAAALMGELLDGLTALGAVSAFVRCHPILGVPLDSLREHGEVVVHGDQVVMDVAIDGDLAAGFRENHRRNLRVLAEKGFTVRFDDESDYAVFPEMYRETMRRVDADPYYLFDDDYFAAVRRELSDVTRLVAAVDPDGVPAAIAMVFICGSIGQYHLGATAEAYLRLAPVKLSILAMAELCRAEGARYLNLGGGVGAREDSLFEFKLGFSKLRMPFATARFVLDAAAYEQMAAVCSAPPGFFPAYRHSL